MNKLITMILTIAVLAIVAGGNVNKVRAGTEKFHQEKLDEEMGNIRTLRDINGNPNHPPAMFFCGFLMGVVSANTDTMFTLIKTHQLYLKLANLKNQLVQGRDFCDTATNTEFREAYVAWHKAAEEIINHIEHDTRNPHNPHIKPNSNKW